MYTLATIISFCGHIILGVLVYSKNKSSEINKLFLLFTTTLAFYILASYLSSTLADKSVFKIVYFIAQLIYASGLAWIFSLCRDSNSKRTLLVLTIGFFLGILSMVDNFAIKEIKSLGINNVELIIGGYYWVFIIYSLAVFITAFSLLFRTIKNEKGIIKKKLMIITFGLIVFSFCAIITSVILPAMGIYQLFYADILLSLIPIGSAAYAMTYYRHIN